MDGDALIVASLCGVWAAYLFFKHTERRRRLDVIHQERLAAMDKGIPLPELPLWLADDFAVPLELEASYEETCRIFRLA